MREVDAITYLDAEHRLRPIVRIVSTPANRT